MYIVYIVILLPFMYTNTMVELKTSSGTPRPYGATVKKDGVNFSLFSRNGTSVTIVLFKHEKDESPYFSYTLDPINNRTGDVWHVHIEGISTGALYLFSVVGPFSPEKGHRFNKEHFLLDPYAKAVSHSSLFKYIQQQKQSPSQAKPSFLQKKIEKEVMPKCVVIDDSDFDWQGDKPLNYPLRKSILYETHLKGFTQSETSGVKNRGTYKGLIEKIPYFKELGVTSIELLPIQEFDEFENSNINPKTGASLTNYWGYSTMSFFSPKTSYASDKAPGQCVHEFKEMIREMHKNGLEVILDIVFNHTAEGNENGPTINFKGLDNSIYYMLEDENKTAYKNYSGCGNTFNCNHPVVRTFIIDCLRYWVCEMHVDGFRFDLGSILGRDQNGELMENPPMLERIAEEPVLRNTKIIAEAWDAGGAYQVGWFPGGRWAEWNDRYRDDIRRFWRGDENCISSAATRLTGSSDLYLRDGRKPFHSINFLTSHDGFTLNDLVSYNVKHNEENGESNRDGSDHNLSFNYGYEGHTINKDIEIMRTRQIKNFLITLFLSQGTPMILAGDEFRHTQNGNNNSYCQDNETSWIDWTCKDKYSEIFLFTRKAIAFRLHHPAFCRPEFFLGQDRSYNSLLDISWFDEHGEILDWSKENKILACRMDGSKAEIFSDRDDNDFFLMLNSYSTEMAVSVPSSSAGTRWYRAVDTSIQAPKDFLPPGEEEIINADSPYVLRPQSVVVLLSK